MMLALLDRLMANVVLEVVLRSLSLYILLTVVSKESKVEPAGGPRRLLWKTYSYNSFDNCVRAYSQNVNGLGMSGFDVTSLYNR